MTHSHTLRIPSVPAVPALLVLLAAAGAAPAVGQSVVFEGPEISVSGTASASDGTTPRMVAVDGGGFAVLWEGMLPGGEGGALHRVFDRAGDPVVPPRAGSAGSRSDRHRIVQRRDGGFGILFWRRANALGDQDLMMALYAADGGFRGGPVPVGGPVSEPWPLAAAGSPEGGRVVAAWAHPTTVDRFGPERVVAQRITTSGAREGGEITVSGEADSVDGLDLAVAADGSFAALWTERSFQAGRSTLLRRFGADGTPLGPAVPVSPFDGGGSSAGAVVPAPGGGVWVAFSALEDPRTLVWLRRFDAAGVGGPVRAVGEGSPGSGTAREIDLAVSADGTLLVTWTTHPPPEDSARMAEVLARAFAADGSPLGPAFRVHLDRVGEQRFPAVAATAPSRFAVVWRSQPGAVPSAEVRARIVRIGAGGAPPPPRSLEPFQVRCDEGRLRGLLARLRVEVSDGLSGPSGVVVGPTRSGDFAGIASAPLSTEPVPAEVLLSFATNPDETPLLRNPERPPLPSVSLARIPPASDLVPAGSAGVLRVLLDPTLDVADPNPEALLVIDNVAGGAGVAADAKPGRGLGELVDPCHERFVEADAHVFRVLRRIVRGEAAGAASFEAAVYRGEDPGLYRIDLYPRTADGRSLGRLAADLEVELTPGGRLWSGLLRLRPRCGAGATVGCTSVTAPTVLKLAGPTFGVPPEPPPRVRLEASGGEDPPTEVLFAWAELLAGATWLEVPR